MSFNAFWFVLNSSWYVVASFRCVLMRFDMVSYVLVRFQCVLVRSHVFLICVWCNRSPEAVPCRLYLMQSNPWISTMQLLSPHETLVVSWNSCHLMKLLSSNSCHLMKLVSSHEALVISWNSCHLVKLLSSPETLAISWNCCLLMKLSSSTETLAISWNSCHLMKLLSSRETHPGWGNQAQGAGGTLGLGLGEPGRAANSHPTVRNWVRTLLGEPS